MQNIEFEVKGRTLIITIDLDAPTEPSKSGKTDVIASTRGNVTVVSDGKETIKMGVNVYRIRQ